MDDFILLGNKSELKRALHLIEYFLNTKLFLKLNKKTTIGKIAKGVEFVGYKKTIFI